MPAIDVLTGLRAARYLFRLTAAERMLLPPYKGSTLRGGFGHAFRRSSCANPEAAQRVKLALSELGQDFGVIGAARLAHPAAGRSDGE